MHLHRKAVRNLACAAALVTFALPLATATSLATPAFAQTAQPSVLPPGTTPSTPATPTAPGVTGNADVAVTPAVAFNPIGMTHTATFICDAGTAGLFGLGGTSTAPTTPPGCYDVQGSVTDITTGAPATIQSATCGNLAAGSGSGTVDCTGVQSPICPVTTVPGTAPPPAPPCVAAPAGTTAGYHPVNTATVTINPGAPDAYQITFTGYIPTTSLGTCPTGTTYAPGVVLHETYGVPPTSAVLPTAPGGACQFSVSADKKYAEITNIVLTGGPCGGTLFYAEGLKSFFGPSCVVHAAVTGTVVLKTGVNCAVEPPVVPAPLPTDFTTGKYACSNGVLSVVGVVIPNVSLDFTVTGPGSFNTLNTLGTSCAGVLGNTTFTTTTGTATFCPTGPGTGSIAACLTGPLPNNQPAVCSNSISFAFTQNAARVVPYVRWAGEKIALTKCFGPGLGGQPVEFNLQGNNPGLNATLIPTNLSSSPALPAGNFPTADTVWTVTDVNGCASVLGYAAGEGVMYVDAAIFSTSVAGGAPALAGNPIVNEHAFEVFYLKFDHVDLENINPLQVYPGATALAPYLSFLAGTPALLGATTFPNPLTFTLPSAPGANMEVAGPNGYAVPLCVVQFIRAMVHGYFEISGDPSGRPATSVSIPGAPLSSGGSPSAGSYTLPAGRWVLPEDWPVLATFAGFGLPGQPGDFTPSSVLAWDLNSGWVFNPSGENPIFCTGDGVFAPDVNPNAGGEGVLFSGGTFTGGFGPIASGDTDLGPCFSKDGNGTAGTFYATAGPVNSATNCVGGETVGIGPFDATQACTTPFPLSRTPSGASLIGGLPGLFPCPNGVIGPCLIPAGLNSTYLPNGTLNQWDAPMPPAQVSIGITNGGPGFLSEVNKTGLYALTLDLGKPATGASCATGYSLDPITGTCRLKVDPNPFYAEAIPASPLIPPVTNNGGYLWNSFNFSAGTVTTVRAAPNCFSNAPAGGCVPGQSTSVAFPTATLGGGVCPNPNFFSAPDATTGLCDVPGGINVTTCSVTGTSDSIIVADGSGFLPGMSVEIYHTVDGKTIQSRETSLAPLVIQAVIPAPQAPGVIPGTPASPAYPNAVQLVFLPGTLSGITGACGPPGSEVFIAEQFGLPVPSASAFTGQTTLTIGSAATKSITVPISHSGLAGGAPLLDTTNNIVYVDNTFAIAVTYGGCTNGTYGGSGLSRADGPAGNPFCEPNLLVPPGTLIETGPVGAGGLNSTFLGAPPNPYPFWQWIPTPPSATSVPTSGTVYSDNHGEAVVSLHTAVATQIAPVAGACPKPYLPLTINGTVTSCQLPFQVLGALGFNNVATARKSFSAGTPGCIQTSPSGTSFAVANGTIGATGPAAGQICINSLGGIEFGASAALGSTTVQAIADYPYTRGEHPPIASPPLTKVFTSAFSKSLTVSSASAAPAGVGITNYTVTITAVDVCGLPLGEPVQVYALGNAGAVVLAPVAYGALLSANTTSSVITVDPITGQAILSLEVLNSAIGNQGLVVKAVFPFEGVERFVTVLQGSTTGATVNVPYAPGWNQVGGPPGSNFSVAEALFSYDPASGTYRDATASAGNLSSAAPLCTGYWAYFAAPMVVSLPATSHSGDTAACALASGWNLVGNPFATPAKLPSGTTAYHWNGTSYDQVGTIPVGGSVWVYETAAATLTLTAT